MAQAKGKSGDRVDKILAKLRRAGVEHVRFELPDMHGSARSKQVPIEWFAQFARDGVNMYGGIIALDSASHVVPGSRYNEEVNYRDQMLIPDLDSLAHVPWIENTARVICDTEWAPGEPLRAAPRYVMREMLKRIDKLGEVVQSMNFSCSTARRASRYSTACIFSTIYAMNSYR